MTYEDMLRYYARDDVSGEIVDWCKDRWVSIQCERVSRRLKDRSSGIGGDQVSP